MVFRRLTFFFSFTSHSDAAFQHAFQWHVEISSLVIVLPPDKTVCRSNAGCVKGKGKGKSMSYGVLVEEVFLAITVSSNGLCLQPGVWSKSHLSGKLGFGTNYQGRVKGLASVTCRVLCSAGRQLKSNAEGECKAEQFNTISFCVLKGLNAVVHAVESWNSTISWYLLNQLLHFGSWILKLQ